MVVPIIFDTDMSIDTDDVGALCVAHALEDLGESRLLAVVHGEPRATQNPTPTAHALAASPQARDYTRASAASP